MHALTFVGPHDLPASAWPRIAPTTPRARNVDTPKPVVMDMRGMLDADPDALERHYWSQGKPALPGAALGPRPEERDPATMSLDDLIATQRSEIPSIARSAFLAGCRVDSLDRPLQSDDGTSLLAETIPADNPHYDVLQTIIDPADMTPEQKQAYDAFSAEFAGSHGTPYVIPDVAISQRIEWERFRRACGDVTREGFRDTGGERMTFFSLMGRRLSRDEFIARKERFVAAFLSRTGLDRVPDAETFRQKRHTYSVLRGIHAFAEDEAINRAVAQALPDPAETYDVDFGQSREVVDEPYIPSLALLIYQQQQANPCPTDATPKQQRQWRDRCAVAAVRQHRALVEAAEDEDPDIQIRFRSARDVDRYHRRNPDALWHATLGAAGEAPYLVTLGADED